MPKFRTPKEALRYHVTGAIERGEGTPIVEKTATDVAVDEIAEAALTAVAAVKAKVAAEARLRKAEKRAEKARLAYEDEAAERADALDNYRAAEVVEKAANTAYEFALETHRKLRTFVREK